MRRPPSRVMRFTRAGLRERRARAPKEGEALRGGAGPGHATRMGPPAGRLPPPLRATYADLEAMPADKVAELTRGALYVMPPPALPHAVASSALGFEIGGPFHRGRGGPGGW